MTATDNRLFPPREERLRVDDGLTRSLADAHDRIVCGSVATPYDVGTLRTALAMFDFKCPRAIDETLAWTIEQMERGLVHVTHPRYFGLFNPAPTFPSQCADRIAAVFNPQLATSNTSPAAVEIELHVLGEVAARVGLPAHSRGHFTTGGSEANYTAVLLALTRACPHFAADGVRALPGPPTFYVSNDSHLAWLKIAHQAGLGRSAMRLVATDGSGRLDLTALMNALRNDRLKGCVPFLIAATAGTTNAGMIDPLIDCADIAHHHGLWYHVDAAWGGGLIASDTLRTRLTGIERADSVTIDAHKWFATTMGCGMFLTRWPALLSSAFQASTTFMPSNVVSVDPYVTSIQWSRRFVGLRLFLSLAAAGWIGHAAHVAQCLALIEHLRQRLTMHGWRVANEPLVGVLCLIPPSGAVRAVVEQVLASGRAWLSVAVLEGREVIRVCVTSGLTTEDDIADLACTLMQADARI